MANVKITELTALTNPASSDVLPIVDIGADETKKVTIADLLENAGSGSASAAAFAFDGDADTGMYRTGANALGFTTGGTGRLFIDSSGNVGVGTSSPSTLLTLSENQGTTLTLRRNNSAAVADDLIGKIDFFNNDGSSPGARITATVGAYAQATAGGTYLAFSTATNGSSNEERLRIDQSGNVGIGTTSPSSKLHIRNTSANDGLRITSSTTGQGYVLFGDTEDSNTGSIVYEHATDSMTFDVNNSEALRIDSSGQLLASNYKSNGALTIGYDANGNNANNDYIAFVKGASSEYMRLDGSGRLLVGTSTAPTCTAVFAGRSDGASNPPLVRLDVPSATPADGAQLGNLYFGTTSDSAFNSGARIAARRDGGTWTANTSLPSRLEFSTSEDGASSPTERMRITSQGYVFVDSSSSALQSYINTTSTGLKVVSTANTTDAKIECFATSTATRYGIVFSNSNGIVGSISTNASATAYNTSSDYRLKENVVPLVGAADRVNQLQVHRFNFIADPDTTVDGFIAHEAQAVVPEAVTGTHDEVDDEGNPVYQGIDQSKLVPLLTAALQEALAEIESLKARVTALEA